MSLERIRHNHTPTTSIHKLKINRNTHTSTLVTLCRPSRHRVEGKGTSARARCWARSSQPTFPRWLTGNLLVGVSFVPGLPFLSSLVFPGSISRPWTHIPRAPSFTDHRLPIPPRRSEVSVLLTSPRTVYLERDNSIAISQGRACAGTCMKMCKTNKLDVARSYDKVAIRQRQIWQHLHADGWLNTLGCPGLSWF